MLYVVLRCDEALERTKAHLFPSESPLSGKLPRVLAKLTGPPLESAAKHFHSPPRRAVYMAANRDASSDLWGIHMHQ